MCVAHARAYLHPWLCLPVYVHAGGVSLEIGIVHDASVIEIAHASVVAESVPAAADRQIVLLPEGTVEGVAIPVIRDIEVFPVGISERRFRVEAEILAYESFPGRNFEDLISESSVVLVEEVCVGICICFFRSLACIDLRVVHHPVVGFVILRGV